MKFSSCVQYLSCCSMEVLICILFWFVDDCHWELVIEQCQLHRCGFWALCKHCQDRARLSSGSWWCGLLLEVTGQLAAWPEEPQQAQWRGQLPSWHGLPNSNCGRGFVVGQLYSVQYKDIFGTPDKVRWDTCEEARPLRLDFQRVEVKLHHVIASMQDCWSWCRTEHSYVGVQYWTDQTCKCPKPFTGVEEHCLEKSTRVGADYQYVMIN